MENRTVSMAWEIFWRETTDHYWKLFNCAHNVMKYYAKKRVIWSDTLFRYWPVGVVAVYHYTHKKFTVIPQALPNTESNGKCNTTRYTFFVFWSWQMPYNFFKILYKTQHKPVHEVRLRSGENELNDCTLSCYQFSSFCFTM